MIYKFKKTKNCRNISDPKKQFNVTKHRNTCALWTETLSSCCLVFVVCGVCIIYHILRIKN